MWSNNNQVKYGKQNYTAGNNNEQVTLTIPKDIIFAYGSFHNGAFIDIIIYPNGSGFAFSHYSDISQSFSSVSVQVYVENNVIKVKAPVDANKEFFIYYLYS